MSITHIAYVDETDGYDRESWSIFYGTIFTGTSEQEAQAKADAYVAQLRQAEPDALAEIHIREVNG